MSADNYITVQKRGKYWWVWMDFASEDKAHPKKDDAHFEKRGEALAYAMGWLRGESIVEYGIRLLP